MTDVFVVDWDDPQARELRAAMMAEMQELYGDDEAHRNRDGNLDIDSSTIEATVVAFEGNASVAHGALRRLGADLEIKRMYVRPDRRGSSAASDVLAALEVIARAGDEHRLILHTGERQAAAIGFYRRHGYTPIEVYEPYDQLAFSLCFEKLLQP